MSMFGLEVNNNERGNKISLHSDPFKKECVKNISINLSTDMSGKQYWWGYVKFENNRTIGEHRMQERPADQFNELVLEIKTFIESL